MKSNCYPPSWNFSKVPLGIRLNNPYNIRYSKRNAWLGQCNKLSSLVPPVFCRFAHYDYGVRAALVLLRNYIGSGVNTIARIVERWAPPTENATANYVEFVSARVWPSLTLEEVRDKAQHTIITGGSQEFLLLVQAMALMETGFSKDIDYFQGIINRFNIHFTHPITLNIHETTAS